MKDTKFRILLDIHEVRSQATIPVKVGDVSCKIYITLVEGGKPYKIHENSFGVFTGKKGDDKHLFNNCVIENGIIRYDFTPQTVAAAGVLECEVRIYDEDGGVLTTPSFNIIVDERAVNDSELASSDEFSFLDEILVNEGQRIQNEKNRNEAFNNLGIDLEDDGEVISIVKTDIDGSQKKSTFLKYADVIPPVTASASGSAITVDSASAPLQNLKLFGKTEQNGTPTPDAPVPLVSVGDSGSFEVGVYGGNIINEAQFSGGNGTDYVEFVNGKIHFVNASGNSFSCATITVKLPKGTYYLNMKTHSHTTKSAPVGIGQTTEQQYINGVSNPTIKYVFDKTTYLQIRLTTQAYKEVGEFYANVWLVAENNSDYQPYVAKQTLTMPYTLPSMDTIKQEVDFNKGIIVKKLGVTTITSSDNISISRFTDDTNNNWNTRFFVINKTTDGGFAKNDVVATSDYFPAIVCFAQDRQGIYSHRKGVGIRIDKSLLADVSTQENAIQSFKNWLSDKTVNVVYQLPETIEIPLTETELNAYRHLYTNKGNTTILSEAEAEIEYYTPYGQALGNIHTQVNNDYFKLQQAIITTGGN